MTRYGMRCSGIRFGISALALAAGALFLVPSASAAVFNVEPIRIDLGPDRLTATATLSTPGSEPLLVEAEAFRWTQEDGEERLEPAMDLIVIPPVFTLEPGAEQTLRIGLPSPPSDASGNGRRQSEVTWRLLLTEVPDETVERAGVSFTLRLSIPVFFTPPGARPELEWSLERRDDGRVDVGLANVGTAHAHVLDLQVLSAAGSETESESVGEGVEPRAVAGRGGYILPGAARSWVLPAEAVGGASRVRLRAPTRGGGEVTGEVRVPAPAVP